VILPFRGAVLQDLRRALAVPLALASAVGLLACPQLLPDDFDPDPSGTDPSCARLGGCASGSGGTALGVAGAAPGTGGSASGTGGSAAGAAGSAPGTGGSAPGTGGSRSDAGGGGQPAAGTGGAGGGTPDAGPDPTDPGCRAVLLNASTHSADDNCVGIEGWNQVVMDDTTTPETEVTLSYQDGKACLEGTIEPGGWGAVYNFTFADEQDWDATDFDVEGFRLDLTGSNLPPSIEVIYTDADDDFCQLITPLATASIPFANSHPNCTGSPGSGTPDLTSLRYLRLLFPASTTAYAIDFCAGLIAIP
jgi:hypothetical protein